MKSRERRVALVILALACIFWGLGFPLTKSLVLALEARGVAAEPWQAAGAPVVVRFALATVVLLVVCLGSLRRFTRREAEQGVGLGVLAGASIALHVGASQTADASVIAFLTQFYTVLVVVFAAWGRRRWPSRWVLACLGLVVIGTAVLSGVQPGSLRLGLGELLALTSAFTIAAQVHLLGMGRYSGNEPTRVSLAMCAAAALCLLPSLAGGGSEVARLCLTEPALLALNLFLGFFITGFLFWLMNRYQPKLDTVEAGLLYTTEPVYAALGAFTLPPLLSGWLGVDYAPEQLTLRLAVGGALVFGANVLLQLAPSGATSAERPHNEK